jgi:hypothetical protein
MSNLIIGVSYKLFPGFVAAARAERGRAVVPMAALGAPKRVPPIVFAGFNAGVAAVVGGLLAGHVVTARGGAVVLGIAGLAYVAAAGRTLSFTLRDPRGRPDPLAVLPG